MITLYQNIDGNQYLTKTLDHSRFLLMHDIKKISGGETIHGK